MEHLLKDLRLGARLLVKHPGMAGIAIVTLALGIGLTTTMFSIVYGAIMRGLPFEEPRQLLHLERNNLSRGIESMEVPIHDYVDWRAELHSFEDIAAFYSGTVNVSGTAAKPERYNGAFITPTAFRLLRVQPFLGRTFSDAEDDRATPPVILMGYHVWRNRYASDPSIIGQTIRANGQVMTVIGVMPEGFRFPFLQDIWIPLRMAPLQIPRGDGQSLEVFGRLKDGVSRGQALVELQGIAQRLATAHPKTNEGVGVAIQPYAEEYIGPEPIRMLWTMLGAVVGVLLIGCANVANLLLARAAVRTKEVAIRAALGASRFRVITQMLSESVVLSAIGAVLGLGIAVVGVRLFNNALINTDVPFWINIRIDGAILLFVTAVTVLAGVVAGILPAIQATGTSVNSVLKDEARGSSSMRLGRFTKGLVIAEIALSCGLLIGAGLMTKSVVQLKTFDYGIATENVFTARIGLFETDYPDSAARQNFWSQLVERLAAQPGVQTASLTSALPVGGGGGTNFAIEGKAYPADRDYPGANFAMVSPAFFETFGTGARSGRVFNESDRGGSLPVVVVNETWAALHSASESPIGKRIRLGASESRQPWMTIIGVVPDMWMDEVENAQPAGMYVPLAQNDSRFLSLAMRVQNDPMGMTSVVRDVIATLDPDLPIYWVRTQTDVIHQETWFYGVFGTLFMVFGFVALFLASIGLYGVMAFAVSRRTQEVGIRMALGAGRGDVLKLFLRQGGIQLVIGVTLGLGLAFLLSQGLTIVLFQVQPTDPVMFAGITLLLVAVGMLASFIPARRATLVSPTVALRYE